MNQNKYLDVQEIMDIVVDINYKRETKTSNIIKRVKKAGFNLNNFADVMDTLCFYSDNTSPLYSHDVYDLFEKDVKVKALIIDLELAEETEYPCFSELSEEIIEGIANILETNKNNVFKYLVNLGETDQLSYDSLKAIINANNNFKAKKTKTKNKEKNIRFAIFYKIEKIEPYLNNLVNYLIEKIQTQVFFEKYLNMLKISIASIEKDVFYTIINVKYVTYQINCCNIMEEIAEEYDAYSLINNKNQKKENSNTYQFLFEDKDNKIKISFMNSSNKFKIEKEIEIEKNTYMNLRKRLQIYNAIEDSFSIMMSSGIFNPIVRLNSITHFNWRTML